MICPRKIDGIEKRYKAIFSRYNSKNIEKDWSIKDPYWNKGRNSYILERAGEETLNSAYRKKKKLEGKVSCKSLQQQRKRH